MGVRLALLVLGITSFGAQAFAQESDSEYLKLLGIAQKAAREQKIRGMLSLNSTSPASAITALGLNRRFFEKGEGWTVAFTPSDEPMVRKSASVEDLSPGKREPFLFDYRVTDIDSGKIAKIEIRQRVKNGEWADPRIDHQILYINENFATVKKETFYRDGRTPRAIIDAPTGNVAVGFSAYPLDLPNLNSTDGVPLERIPNELKGKSLDPKKALDFQFNDLYARPARAIWLDGEVWPVFTKTQAGVSVVVSYERARR